MKKSSDIEISVVLPVFNAQEHLLASIESVLCQTFREFELIIIDDGSTDNSREIMNKMAGSDPRIRILRNVKNLGVQISLNRGFEASNGNYIARMDADDISLPSRLEKQLSTFYEDDSLIMVGSNAILVTDALNPVCPSLLPLDDWTIRCLYLMVNPFIHSTVMLDAREIRKHNLYYSLSVTASIDYELWARVMKYGSVRNLSDQLVLLRKHNRSASYGSNEQTESFVKTRTHYWENFLGQQRFSKDGGISEKEFSRSFTQMSEAYPFDSLMGCENAIQLIKTVKRNYPEKSTKSAEIYICSRSLWTSIRCFTQKESWLLMGKLLVNYYTIFGGLILYHLKALKFVLQTTRISRYRTLHNR